MENVIKNEDLLMQIKTALCDEFVAEIETVENRLGITFSNGQKFTLTLS